VNRRWHRAHERLDSTAHAVLEPDFPATREAALARIEAIQLARYAATRNHLAGAVSALSPYITHGFTRLPEITARLSERGALPVEHKYIFELGWRAFFRHAWGHLGQGILDDLHEGPLPRTAYANELPADIRAGRTGVPVIDQAVAMLYRSGWLHNHARMWLASYVVHVRKVHWRAGADWLYGHLLDGDLASNHLSWQWVAGTGSHKPYLFNAENVARYAPPEWHSPGTVIDTSYETLDLIARGRQRIAAPAASGPGVDEPALHSAPPADALAALPVATPDAAAVRGRRVWLIHPWALDEVPADLPTETLRIAVLPQECWAHLPWSAQRWQFVLARMAELEPAAVWSAPNNAMVDALRAATQVHGIDDPHLPAGLRRLKLMPEPALFPAVERPCSSFTQYWTRATKQAKDVADLLGGPPQASLFNH
jgi:deoxyribodipyrimidine photo-lyase